ncbi:DcaP family trimeric outer membrane transporter [Paraglaciecola sp. L3A3]|uniref:DcaP family trimeric outer membrane transporter n=1 Tax=Paraglaciecola sp. L3A3 TaxID=2686358 RepID=UPI00131C989B|nr:DcaP family trimeric outer membrane transporter [Paraglaciecola sp. L3A3]
MNNIIKKSTALGLLLVGTQLISSTANAAPFEIDFKNGNKIKFGGYLKADARYVSGDLNYQDYWIGNNPGAVDTSKLGLNIKESRFNISYIHGDWTGFVEMDFYGGGGNEIISNSVNPRLRHAFVKNKNWLIGQTWSTFMPLAALVESLDFGGPMVAEGFIRQVQIRYSVGNWQFALENSQTFGDNDGNGVSGNVGVTGSNNDPDSKMPDFVARYNFQGDWGQASVAGLLRKVDQGGIDATATAISLSGKINSIGKDDIRFQLTLGESGRYAGITLATDIVVDPISNETKTEDTTAWYVGYRRMWSDEYRSTIFYGNGETDILGHDRSHYAVNLIRQYTPNMIIGVELGKYVVDDGGLDLDSSYLQTSVKFTL